MKLYNWSRVPEEQLSTELTRRTIHGSAMTVARISLRKGARVPLHNHENEQICMVEKGALRFESGGEEQIVQAGELLRIPPHAPHLAEALEDSVVIDLFSPVREDWVRGEDAYLRG